MTIIVVVLMVIIAVLLFACILTLDDIERHDEAVRMRWANQRESTPPEWADADKWWESER